jgi:xylulokinase
MTGEYVTDPSDGSGALLLDVRRRMWAAEMLALLGLTESQLPRSTS